MVEQELTTNYALNIWFSLVSEDEGEETGYWLIEIYELMILSGDGVEQEVENERKRLANKTVYLTAEETEKLALGSDEDFWLHTDEFFDSFENIPDRVENLLRELPAYQMETIETQP